MAAKWKNDCVAKTALNWYCGIISHSRWIFIFICHFYYTGNSDLIAVSVLRSPGYHLMMIVFKIHSFLNISSFTLYFSNFYFLFFLHFFFNIKLKFFYIYVSFTIVLICVFFHTIVITVIILIIIASLFCVIIITINVEGLLSTVLRTRTTEWWLFARLGLSSCL